MVHPSCPFSVGQRARPGVPQTFRNTVTFSRLDTRVALKPLSTETPCCLICRIVPDIGHFWL
jgi:hypothetical protein